MVSGPPASCSMRWSASVAGCPHQWHGGLLASSCVLAALYCGVRCLLAIVGCLLSVVGVYPIALHPYQGVRATGFRVGVSAVLAPHISDLSVMAAGCLTPLDGHHSHL